MTAVPQWHIITCEYPPQVGGVSDYTRVVAKALAEQGDRVHVWCPSSSAPGPAIAGVEVHRTLGHVTVSDLIRLDKCLNQFPSPRRLLVQWVPHGYGYQSMNLPFCVWLWNRAKVSKDEIDLMVHEPFLPFGEGSWKQQAAAAVHRIMATIILNAAMRVWISIPAWEDRLRPYLFGRRIPMEWLPVPSTLECDSNLYGAAAYSDCENVRGRVRIGHFGTYGSAISNMLQSLTLPLLQDHPNRVLVLMGQGSTEFRSRIVAQNRSLNDQIVATGEIAAAELSSCISRCNLMIQPYPDGVSSRRTTAMVALSRAVPIVTTIGPLTENVWTESNAVRLAPTGDTIQFVNAVTELLSDTDKRIQLGRRGRELYLKRFDVSHTLQALRREFHNLPSCSATAVTY